MHRVQGEVRDLHRLRCRYGGLLQTVRWRAQAQIGSQHKAGITRHVVKWKLVAPILFKG